MTLMYNRIPEQVKTIHLIAVCGSGMGALAGMLKEMGYQVTGSDQGVYPPMSDFLRSKGIEPMEGFRPEHLNSRPDLVIVGNAVTAQNPEAVAMQEKKLNYCSMPQAINHFVVGNKKALLVTGTHGKTSTSSLLAWVLYSAKLDPSFFIGGILRDFDSNFRLGNGDFMVIEGDEYDTAFFDKGPKFLHYPPHTAILTGIEFDHADIYRDLDHIRDSFRRLINKMKPDSALVVFDGDVNSKDLTPNCAASVFPYGLQPDSPWRLEDIRVKSPWTFFRVRHHQEVFGEFKTRMVGRHNLLNALAVIAVAHRLGIEWGDIAVALETFKGPKRRQEIRGVKRGVTVIDDFAHHPTAVRETIKAIRPHYPDGRLIAVFEPRTNTSMRNVFQNVYPTVFDEADIVCIRKPSRLDKIPAGERFSSEKLVMDLSGRGKKARYFDDTEGIIDFVLETARKGDVVLIMSNGGFDNIHQRLLDEL